jgi:V8-like Glu-specific endopeptidase
MQKNWQRRGVRAAALTLTVPAVVLGTVAGGVASARGSHPSDAATTLAAPARIAVDPAATARAVIRYWTPARMASARPVAGAAAGTGAPAVSAGDSATGAPGTAGGYDPLSLSPVASPAAPINTTTTGVGPADGSYPGPNDTFNWFGKTKAYPVSTVGKLFFTEPSGNFVCSAATTIGNSSQPNMIWTAGHCVGPQGGRSYYSNFLFCPQYNGKSPVGCWSWASAQQTGNWYFNGYWSADYAYLYLSSTGTKKAAPVTNVVGGLGFGWNWSRDQFWQDFGYPSESPYSGSNLVVTSAEHRYDVTNPNGTAGADPGPADDSIGSSQTPGFSGGPWILGFGRPGAGDPLSHGDWINGNNSYYFTSGGPSGGNEYGVEIQSPYYDTNACNFWKGGSGWTGTC